MKTYNAEEKEVATKKVIGRNGNDAPNLPIPQFDGTFYKKLSDEKAHSELKDEAHEKCTNSDVIEAIQENFFGADPD